MHHFMGKLAVKSLLQCLQITRLPEPFSSCFTGSPCCCVSSRGWGFCLDDRPSKRDLTTPLARLGLRYTTHHQCQLQYGPNATFCHEVDVSAASPERPESPEQRTPGLTGRWSSLRTFARSSGVQSTAPVAPSWTHR